MLFGVCNHPDASVHLVKSACDFIETNVQGLLKPEASDEEFQPELEKILASKVPVKVANCFYPGDIKLTGPVVDIPRIEKYAHSACKRARQAGMDTIVFGSGGARRIPDGFDRAEAWSQLVDFGKRVGAIAAQYGITIVVEPLRQKECNVLTSVGKGAQLVKDVNHPHFRLLIDAYHWLQDDDSYDDLVASCPLISHAHIATKDNRKVPTLEPCDFSTFFKALKAGGYNGRLSIEANWPNLAEECVEVMQKLRAIAAQHGF
jgi:sugar phosphate isomerase/epimerase